MTENRICDVLRTQLYSMADHESQNSYEPLKLEWALPVESTHGMMAAFKNILFVLHYVQTNSCNEEVIDKIIENDLRPIISGVGDEYGVIMALCCFVDGFSSTEELMTIAHEMAGKFIRVLEEGIKQLESGLNEDTQEVDISRLESGMVVKNYKEMCEILGEEICDGNSKKYQLKEWGRYFAWEKKGQKFIVLDLYDEPFPKDDGRKNKNIYVQYIEVILMKILSRQRKTKDPFYITTNQMWKLLGMINDNYKKISLDDLNSMIAEYKVTSFDMNKFYQRCNQRLRDILFSSLNKLESRALIKYEIETVIVYLDGNGKTIYEPADDIQKKKILKVEKKVLSDMRLESKQHAYAKFKEKEFFDNVNAYLYERYGWEYTFNRIKIIYNKEDVLESVYEDEIKLKNDLEEMKLQRLRLNDRIVDALYKNAQVIAENQHKKADREYKEAIDKYMDEHAIIGNVPTSFLPTKKELHIFDYSQYFVELQNKMTDELICIRKPKEGKTVIEFNDAESKELDELFKN